MEFCIIENIDKCDFEQSITPISDSSNIELEVEEVCYEGILQWFLHWKSLL